MPSVFNREVIRKQAMRNLHSVSPSSSHQTNIWLKMRQDPRSIRLLNALLHKNASKHSQAALQAAWPSQRLLCLNPDPRSNLEDEKLDVPSLEQLVPK